MWRPALLLGLILLAGCAGPLHLGDARVLLFGEQHDQPDQQRRVAVTVETLAARGELAALVLEMAERGRDTRALPRTASPAEVREALQWSQWPWEPYEGVVMNAVRAGVAVWGGNLQRSTMRPTMADAALEDLIPASARK
ncbi:MAG: ChaN family lipoprotein, partial [Rubrivivax sp.]|nr:ChaN family lipoprotein [Rubrivivax sp.]